MLELPLRNLRFNNEVEFVFPSQLCCNCGARMNLRPIVQDTRRTTYMFGGGTEITFQLPLPFCVECEQTAKRRPKTPFDRLLVFAAAFGAAALASILIGDFVLESPFIANYLVPISLVAAALVSAAWLAMSRPRRAQTSYFQPVRIPRLKREFVSGVVTAIGFSFSNKDYAAAFAAANRAAIAKGVVTIEDA